MGARVQRRVGVMGMVFGMVVGLAPLVLGPARAEAQALRPRQAVLVIYNAGAHQVDVGLQVPGFRGLVADDLVAGGALLAGVPAGRARIEAMGAGRLRWPAIRPELKAGHAYCLVLGGRTALDLREHSRLLLARADPARECARLLRR